MRGVRRLVVVLVLLALLAGAAVVLLELFGGGTWEQPGPVETEAAPPLRRRRTVPAGAEAGATVADGGRAGDGAAPGVRTVDVHVRVLPEDADLGWRIDIVAAGTDKRARAVVASEPQRGSVALEGIELPDGPVEVCIACEGAAGAGSYRIDADQARVPRLEFELWAWASVRGAVRARDNRPVSGARVLLAVAAPLTERQRGFRAEPTASAVTTTALTDDDGRFVVERIDAGNVYNAAATHPGFAVARVLGVRVRPAAATELEFVLDPGARVTGRLVDERSEPLAAVGLRLARGEPTADAAGIHWDDEGSALTGGDGHFAFDCLGSGWKKIETVHSEPGECRVGFWDVRLAAGETRDLGTLVLGAGLLDVRIVTDDGRPAADVDGRIVVTSGSGDAAAEAAHLVSVRSDASGLLRLRGLPPGHVSARLYGDTRPDAALVRRDTEIELDYAGGSVQAEWRLRAWEPTGAEPVAPSRELRLPETFADAVFLVIEDGHVRIGGRCASGGVGLRLPQRDGRRLVVIRGGRYADIALTDDVDAEVLARTSLERTGRRLSIAVLDAGRGVPGATVVVSDSADGRGGTANVGATGTDGTLVIDGVPHDLDLHVSAWVLGRSTPYAAPTWKGNDGTVELEAQPR